MKLSRETWIVLGVILLGIAFLTTAFLMRPEPHKYFAQSLRNYQEADTVPGYPIAGETEGEYWTAEFIPELNLLSSVERYRLPTAHGFEDPFQDGAAHASGNALVLMTGKQIVLGHRLPSGRIVQSLYRGVSNIKVRVGQLIPRGGRLGLVTEEPTFEFYESDGIDLESSNRVDTQIFLTKHPPETAFPEPLAIIKNQESSLGSALQKLKLDAKSAEKLSEILGNE